MAEGGSAMKIEIIPTNAALGAEVRCGDVRKLDDATVKAVRQAWLDHLVIVIRGQQLTDAVVTGLGEAAGADDDVDAGADRPLDRAHDHVGVGEVDDDLSTRGPRRQAARTLPPHLPQPGGCHRKYK